MKKYILSIVACVVLLGGLVSFYYIQKSNQANVQPSETPAPVGATSISLLNRAPGDAVSLELTRENSTTTYLRSETGTWVMQNIDASLDQSLISDIVEKLCTLTAAEKTQASLDNPADYGFAPPVSSLTITFRDSTSATVHLGARTPGHNYYYMMLDGDPSLYLIQNTFGERFSHSMGDLLNRVMLSIESADALTHLLIQSPNQTPIEAFADLKSYDPAIQSAEAYQIYMSSPVDGKRLHTNAFQEKVLAPLNSVSLGALVAPATPETLTQYGLDAPVYTILLESKEKIYQLTVGNFFGEANEKAYAMYAGQPFIFEIDAAPIHALTRLSAFDFMDKLVSVYNIDYVDRLLVQNHAIAKDYDFTLAHTFIEGDGLTIADYDQITPQLNGTPMGERAFRDLYATIILITYDATLDAYTPAGDPALTISYEMNDGSGPYTDLYYDYDVNFYAIVKEDLGAFLVSKPYVKTVLDSLEAATVQP